MYGRIRAMVIGYIWVHYRVSIGHIYIYIHIEFFWVYRVYGVCGDVPAWMSASGSSMFSGSCLASSLAQQCLRQLDVQCYHTVYAQVESGVLHHAF